METGNDNRKINCLFASAEVDPLVKVGGLGDVAFALPQALNNLQPETLEGGQIETRLVIPCHSTACLDIENMSEFFEFKVQTASGSIPARTFTTNIDGLTIYLIYAEPIARDPLVYSEDLYRDGLKFTFFSMAILELVRMLDWKIDILHANDWHTAISIYRLDMLRQSDHFLKDAKSVITVHNLPYMGVGTETALDELGIPPSQDRRLPTWARYLPMPMGLSVADEIVAVSPTYAREIMTPEFGCGLQNYLMYKNDRVSGILNGVDVQSWNPETDRNIFANYTAQNLEERKKNKQELIAEFSLDPSDDIPLLIFIGRMDLQKGVDLAIGALRQLINLPWQVIFLGKGNLVLEEEAHKFESDHPDKVRAITRFDGRLARRMYAGGDMILMPSLYEPCGLAQMIGMRYGCIPLGRATGGLKDTIIDIEDSENGTGFIFEQADPNALAVTIRRALSHYQYKLGWEETQIRGMKQDFSWHKSALKYAGIYQGLKRGRNEN
jgi:starch synthase